MNSAGLFACLLAAGLIELSCDTPSGPLPGPPASPSQRWKIFRPEEYSVVERRGCFCTPDTAARITVRGNVIIAAENVVSGEPLTRQQWSVYHPVDDLFVIIELAERDSEATVVAEYDALYGYPIGLGIDPKWWISDDEVSYSLTNFIPIPHLPQDEPTGSYHRGPSRSPSFTFPPPPTGDGAGRRFR